MNMTRSVIVVVAFNLMCSGCPQVAGGAVAVLFLNAATDVPQDIPWNAPLDWSHREIGVRDVWGKNDLPHWNAHARRTYTAHNIPPQDSRLLLFTPHA